MGERGVTGSYLFIYFSWDMCREFVVLKVEQCATCPNLVTSFFVKWENFLLIEQIVLDRAFFFDMRCIRGSFMIYGHILLQSSNSRDVTLERLKRIAYETASSLSNISDKTTVMLPGYTFVLVFGLFGMGRRMMNENGEMLVMHMW